MSLKTDIDSQPKNDNISFSLSNDIFKDIPFHKYENNFTFIVDGKRYETNRIVADILSPIIRNSHYQDESLNEFIINTKTNKSQKSEAETDYFRDFLNFAYLNEVEIDPLHQEYYIQFFTQLGNQNFLKIDAKICEKLNKDNCVNYLKKFSLFERSQNTDIDDIYDQVIKFVSHNFEEISKDELKTLNLYTIDSILRNEEFQLEKEDTLLEFLLDLYKENCENAPLFEHVLLNNVSDELFNEFIETFSIEDIDSIIWRSIIYSLKKNKRRNKNDQCDSLDKDENDIFEFKCLMLGLDDSGKTQLLYKMKLNVFVATISTLGFNVETINRNDININIWDVGGADRIRSLWRHYYENVNAIIFVVDSTNVNRLVEAKTELHKILENDQLMGVPFLILANKSDKPNSLSVQELFGRLELNKITDRKWLIQKSSALTDEGLNEGLDFISKQANLSKTQNNQ